MVRRCIVPNCKSLDNKILCHRFPTRKEISFRWVVELGLDTTKYTNNDLKKYVVCTLHFDKKDYKHEESHSLNTTALPKLSGHESRVKLLNLCEPINYISTFEISILENIKNEEQPNKQNYSSFEDVEDYDDDISFGINDLPKLEKTETEKSLNVNTMETSIIECSESEIFRIDEDLNDPEDCNTIEDNLISTNDELLTTQNLQVQQYESDIEIIDYNDAADCDSGNHEDDIEIMQTDLPRYERCTANLSETVSLISSLAEADEEDCIEHDIEKTFADAACQSDSVEILCKAKETDANELEDEEYKNKSRKDLIELIKEQKKKIIEVDQKLKEFQATHIKLVQSMDAFKILLTKEVDNNS